MEKKQIEKLLMWVMLEKMGGLKVPHEINAIFTELSEEFL